MSTRPPAAARAGSDGGGVFPALDMQLGTAVAAVTRELGLFRTTFKWSFAHGILLQAVHSQLAVPIEVEEPVQEKVDSER